MWRRTSAKIGNAGYDMSLSVNQGVPLVVDKRTHQTSKDIFALANMLSSNGSVTAKAGEKPPEKPPENRGLLGRFRQR